MVESLLHNWFYWMSAIAVSLSLLLICLAMESLGRIKEQNTEFNPRPPCFSTIPISIIIPAYNEQSIICDTIQALLKLQYTNYEIIIVNDGSSDKTLSILKKTLQLRQIPVVASKILPHQPILHLFESELEQRIRVVDKYNGGKFDALNAGISISKYSWFCCVDADTILMPDALWRLAVQIERHPSLVAATGQIRVGNTYSILHKISIRKSLSNSGLLMTAQAIEYIRSFVIERIGWNKLNGLVIVPGAFSLFNKQAVYEVGGYSADMPSEDVELVIKLHRYNLHQGRKYKILYTSDAVAWTEAPISFSGLARQRGRWYHGLWAALFHHRSMLFNPRYRIIGLFVLPYLLLFELLQPIFGVVMLAHALIKFDLNVYSVLMFLTILCLNFVSQGLISTIAIFIDWNHFHRCYSSSHMLRCMLMLVPIERSIYALLQVLFKTQALITFIHSPSQECGKWQTSNRMGLGF